MSENREGMVERVARAICWKDGRVHPDMPGLDGNPCWMSYERHARAAIEAMAEPTEQMLRRGDQGQSSEYVWQAMIDAALSEDGESLPACPNHQSSMRALSNDR